jgi:multiple RNA-binding domain-containing protein 1
MSSRIIVKNLPKKITEDKFRTHFGTIGQITDATLKYTKDGKFRNFGFIGYKTEEEASKAIEYFNNTFIDASKLVVENCLALNSNKERPWSKYSKESSTYQKKHPEEMKEKKKKIKAEKESKINEIKSKKIDELLGDLKDDEGFKEFLAENKAIKSTDNIWRNDIDMNNNINNKTINIQTPDQDEKETDEKTPQNDEDDKSKTKEKKKDTNDDDEDEGDFENGRLFIRNLSYSCKEEELEKLFSSYGPLVEVTIPLDGFSKVAKGFAYVQCMFPEKAIKAFNDLDGTIFQGRMLHIIPAKNKKQETNDDEGNLKQQKFQIKKRGRLFQFIVF